MWVLGLALFLVRLLRDGHDRGVGASLPMPRPAGEPFFSPLFRAEARPFARLPAGTMPATSTDGQEASWSRQDPLTRILFASQRLDGSRGSPRPFLSEEWWSLRSGRVGRPGLGRRASCPPAWGKGLFPPNPLYLFSVPACRGAVVAGRRRAVGPVAPAPARVGAGRRRAPAGRPGPPARPARPPAGIPDTHVDLRQNMSQKQGVFAGFFLLARSNSGILIDAGF